MPVGNATLDDDMFMSRHLDEIVNYVPDTSTPPPKSPAKADRRVLKPTRPAAATEASRATTSSSGMPRSKKRTARNDASMEHALATSTMPESESPVPKKSKNQSTPHRTQSGPSTLMVSLDAVASCGASAAAAQQLREVEAYLSSCGPSPMVPQPCYVCAAHMQPGKSRNDHKRCAQGCFDCFGPHNYYNCPNKFKKDDPTRLGFKIPSGTGFCFSCLLPDTYIVKGTNNVIGHHPKNDGVQNGSSCTRLWYKDILMKFGWRAYRFDRKRVQNTFPDANLTDEVSFYRWLLATGKGEYATIANVVRLALVYIDEHKRGLPK